MCGITASIVDPASCHITSGIDSATLAKQLEESLHKIRHRGPDDSAVWISDDGAVGLGHCRLAINDLSSCGRQPLASDDGRIHAIVNGEIYDYARLRNHCADEHGYNFSSDSDSELVVALYKIYGTPGFFEHLRGEFAFVLCDESDCDGERRVIAGRDRFGIKPLWWTKSSEGRILVASEAKAFLPLGWKPKWDVKAIASGSWLYEGSLFKGVKRIPHGHYVEVKGGSLQIHRYYESAYRDKNFAETRSVDEMILGVRERLVESVRLRLRADVPVGVYLSGGIDSAAVAGIVRHLVDDGNNIGNETSTRLTCFTIGFPGGGEYDESAVADRTAEWLGVDLIKLQSTEQVMAEGFQACVYHCEHHNANLGTVAKFALSQLPNQHGFKVVLTGEGADEHFAGYASLYMSFLSEGDPNRPTSSISKDSNLREKLRQRLSRIVGDMRISGPPRKDGSREVGPTAVEVNGSELLELLLQIAPQDKIFSMWVQQLAANEDYTRNFTDFLSPSIKSQMRSSWHPLHTALYIHNQTLLPGLILTSLGDRVEMAHSLEARTPFLDHHLTEYVNHLPPSIKIAYMASDAEDLDDQPPDMLQISDPAGVLACLREKWILREAVRPFVTDELYRRRKHMFQAPRTYPVGGSLHRKMKEILTRDSIKRLGFVSWDHVCQALDTAFGESADTRSFREVLSVAAWVTLSEQFGIPEADDECWD